jgi:two-component system response regulator NreC
MTLRVLLADDHAVLRAGLRLLIEAEADMIVVGEAADGREAIAQAIAQQPDVLLLDLSMPGLGGLAALGRLRCEVPETKVLVLTMHEDQEYARQVLRGGGAGYILKQAADVEVLTAIRAVAQGQVYVHSSLTRALLEDMLPPAPLTDPWETLSEQEQVVIRRVAQGYTGREIAAQLALSPKTVETYKARAMKKLRLSSRVQLVRYALQKGLLETT